MPSRRRAPRLAVTTLALSLTVPLSLTACDVISNAIDCANTAVTIAETVNELQAAVASLDEDPAQALASLDEIDRNLDELGDQTEGADVGQATEDLRTAVDNVRAAIESGDPAPDLTPVLDASDSLTDVCSPG
ncbi:hypothetical protein [Streptomyces aidingensis]|uniref:Secreted protein n=1 Tax=Streptomyces aidingensis TaxID=910347 RepID=A0A1I1NJ81_9ACTN|nr:hypothetical protein [Streptomyces aidingensis]SFC97689.1 hypothetical protein SAMN05421773_10830 [Streptomyces aidingensis]